MLVLCNVNFFLIAVRAEIVSHPQANVTKEEGSELTLFCNATGNPAPIILWTKDGSPINNNSRIRFSIHNRLLTISNVNRTDSGHYRCVANNSLGNDTSNVASVDIQCKFSYHYCILFSHQVELRFDNQRRLSEAFTLFSPIHPLFLFPLWSTFLSNKHGL